MISTTEIGNITGDFIGNYAQGYSAMGGAITSCAETSATGSDKTNIMATIGNITGDFIGNYAQGGSSFAYGGAIYNNASNTYKRRTTATIGDITGDFINNYAQSTSSYAYGGAIYNYANNGSATETTTATIGDITGDFIGNDAQGGSYARGGAIYNYASLGSATIGNITGDFINNYAQGGSSFAYGGAIGNYAYYGSATIGNITGDFINNYAQGGSSFAYGGAIYNYASLGSATIGNITGDFINNYAQSSSYARGGAIGNYAYNGSATAQIGAINSNFYNNHAEQTSTDATDALIYGGAISNNQEQNSNNNRAIIKSISGEFVENGIITNSTNSATKTLGGAIYNNGTITEGIENSTFSGNYAKSSAGTTQGGAIYNTGTITNGVNNSSFVGNYAENTNGTAQGGAIFNNSNSSNIKKFENNTFENNYVVSTSNSDVKGGAIANIDTKPNTIETISGTFNRNYAQTNNAGAYGGAIANHWANISAIEDATFNNNYVLAKSGNAYGGAIYNNNYTYIENISADFTSNKAQSERNARGGAIYNSHFNDGYANKETATISGTFTKNIATGPNEALGGAIANDSNSYIGNLQGTFNENNSVSTGGWAEGGAVWNSNGSTIKTLDNSTFNSNVVQSNTGNAQGGAIYNGNNSTIENLTATFTSNGIALSKNARGGAIFNGGTMNITNSVFDGNTIIGSELARGGAIFNQGNLTITNTSFTNNTARIEGSNNPALGAAIYSSSNLTIIANNGVSEFDNNLIINGNYGERRAIYIDNSATLTLNASNNGVITLKDFIGGNFNGSNGYNVRITGDSSGTVNLYSYIEYAKLTVENVKVNMADGKTIGQMFNSLNSNANAKYSIDLNFTTGKADNIYTYNASSGTVTIDSINFIGEFSGPITVKILDTPNSNLQLALSSNFVTTPEVSDTVTNQTIISDRKIELTTTTTTNDSIKIYTKIYDTLKMISSKITSNERNFNFVDTSTYTVNENIGTVSEGTLNINGMVEGTEKSTIDMNDHSGFVLENKTNLNISDVKIINAVSSERGSVITVTNGKSNLTINNVDFENNSIDTNGNAFGSVISSNNYGKIGDINANFVSNSINSNGNWIEGGAIWNSNYSSIGNISGSFESNTINGNKNNSNASGGAIYNNWYSKIKQITANFKENAISGKNAKGGAIYNNANSTIESISGTFSANHADAKETAQGGAIHNSNSTIGEIKNSTFKDNYVKSENGTAQGGAIYTNSNITIVADNGTSEFTGNYSQLGNAEKNYNAIYVDNSSATLNLQANNNGTIILNDNIDGARGYNVNITGDGSGTLNLFNDIKNANVSVENINVNTVDDKTHNYTFLSLNSDENVKYSIDIDLAGSGSADKFTTTNLSTGTITLDTINLKNHENYGSETTIQIIDNQNTSSTLQLVLGTNFVELPDAGTDVTNKTIITAIGGIILDTTTTTNDSIKIQGKIYDNLAYVNQQEGENRSFTFEDTSTYTITENLGTTSDGKLVVKGLSNSETNSKSTIDMNNHSGFVLDNGNKTLNIQDVKIINAVSDTDRGSVINMKNNANAEIINVDFANNKSQSSGDALGSAVSVGGGSIITTLSGSFTNNSANSSTGYYVEGGAVWVSNSGKMDNLIADFTSNSAVGTANVNGGAIFNNNGSEIQNVEGNFTNNSAQGLHVKGGAIYNGNNAIMDSICGQFKENYAHGDYATYGGAIYNEGNIAEIKNSVFTGNYAIAVNETALGGAIYTKNDLNFIADNGVTAFSGNYTQSGETVDNNAIYVDSSTATITLETKNNGIILFDDNIKGQNGYTVDIKGDNTSAVIFNNTVEGANVKLTGTQLALGRDDALSNGSSLDMNDATLSMANKKTGTMTLETFTLTGQNNVMSIDIDPVKSRVDRIVANNYNIADDAVLTIGKLNLVSAVTRPNIRILFADENFAKNVVYKNGGTVVSPIFKYTSGYFIDSDKNGYFMLSRGVQGDWKSYNPAVLSSSAVTQAGAYTTMVQTFNYAFSHLDTYMNMPKTDRITYKHSGKYAVTGDATMSGVFSPLMTSTNQAGFWVKPYATFENIPLKHGPKVQNINYGTLIGYDSPMESVKYGWDRVMTYYIGYNGSTQHFSGIDSYQNGGLAGLTMTLYKGNFFNATTVSAGSTVGEISTMYGNETFTSIMAGIANKIGYNFDFKEGRFIIQPSMLLTYSFVNTFDYTNAAGVRIDSNPLSVIQVAPGLKFIGNTKTGWQPYFAVSMVWNITCDSTVRANNLELPSMSIDPFVQYGLGLQRRVANKFIGFIQAMIQNGGRNGVALTAGFRWTIGK